MFMLVVVPQASAEIGSVFDGKLTCVTWPSGIRDSSGPNASVRRVLWSGLWGKLFRGRALP